MFSKIISYKICLGVSGLFFVIFLGLGIFGHSLINSTIQQQALSNILMTSQNYKQWGAVPGSLNTNISRYYTMFNFTNPYEVVYFNATPIFYETTPNLYQEYSNFTNPVFTDIQDGNLALVKYYYMLQAYPNNVVPNQMIQTVNVGPLGYWAQAKTAPNYQIAASILYKLVTNLQYAILPSACSTGFYYQLYPTYEKFASTYQEVLSDEAQLNATWFDSSFGLSQIMTMTTFLRAGLDGMNSGAAYIIQDYFRLSFDQIDGLIGKDGVLTKNLQGILSSLSSRYNCQGTCDPVYLAALQWTSQGVTSNPPPNVGIPANPSVTYINTTLAGYPELSYFISDYMIPTFNLDPARFNVSFSVNLGMQLLNLTPTEGFENCVNENTLIHQGNLEILFDVGAQFDATNQTDNLTLLEPIQTRFGLPSLEHAFAIYRYMQYLYTEFGPKQSIGGNQGIMVLGNDISSALVTNMENLASYLLPELLGNMVYNNVTQNYNDCPSFINASIGSSGFSSICEMSYFQNFGLDSIQFLIEMCFNNFTLFNLFQAQANLTGTEINNLCSNPTTNTFGSIYQYSSQYLHDYYNCTPYATSCSQLEIATKQWGNSTITRDVPEVLKNIFPIVSNTISDWNPTLFPEPFEYYYVIQNLSRNFQNENQLAPLDTNTSSTLLNFRLIYNPFMISLAFIYAKTNLTAFSERFLNVDPQALTTYLRYMMIEVYLGGISQVRDTNSLLWGYTDPFLQYLQNVNALEGGDPAINYVVSLAGANMTYEDAQITPYIMYTGTNQSDLVRKYYKIYDSEYITVNRTEFNGNKTYNQFVNPWATQVKFNGTDSSINMPGITSSDIMPVYVNSLFININFTYSQPSNIWGLNALQFVIPPLAFGNITNNPGNIPFYSNRWNGLVNQTAIQQLPLFISKGHFYQADPEIQQAVLIYTDETLTDLVVPGSNDDTYVNVEPYTGANIGGMIRLQASYEFAQDDLFVNPNYAMLPIYFLNRGANITQDQVNTAFGPLLTGESLLYWIPIVGWVGAVLMLIVIVFVYSRLMRKLRGINLTNASEIRVDDHPLIRTPDMNTGTTPISGLLDSETTGR